jgi:hypothetical protein
MLHDGVISLSRAFCASAITRKADLLIAAGIVFLLRQRSRDARRGEPIFKVLRIAPSTEQAMLPKRRACTVPRGLRGVICGKSVRPHHVCWITSTDSSRRRGRMSFG